MKNLEIVASKLTKLWPFNQISSNCVYMYSFQSTIVKAKFWLFKSLLYLIKFTHFRVPKSVDCQKTSDLAQFAFKCCQTVQQAATPYVTDLADFQCKLTLETAVLYQDITIRLWPLKHTIYIFLNDFIKIFSFSGSFRKNETIPREFGCVEVVVELSTSARPLCPPP